MTTTIDVGDLGERKAHVEYDYFPGEPANYHWPNPHPASDEEVTIGEVMVEIVAGQPVDVLGLLSANAITTLEEQAVEDARSDEYFIRDRRFIHRRRIEG